jgi:GTPase SAR1 family protein
MVELLVLGPEGSGKTLLIRKFKQLCTQGDEEGDQSESTIPTVGVDISSVDVNGISLDIREIGATMASKWESYYLDCSALVFVIDVSDLGALPSDLVLLHEVLSNRLSLLNKPFAILFNKIDIVSDPSTIAVFYNVLRIEDLQNENCDALNIVLLSGSSLGSNSSALCLQSWVQSFIKS